MFDVGAQERFQTPVQYVSSVADSLLTVVEAVRKHQMKASAKQKFYFDVKINRQCYFVGEKVWVRDKARRRGVCPKLQRRYKGPYTVVKRVSEVLYKLLDQEKVVEIIVNFNRL